MFYLYVGRSSFSWKLHNIVRTRAPCCVFITSLPQFAVACYTRCATNTTKRVVSNNYLRKNNIVCVYFDTQFCSRDLKYHNEFVTGKFGKFETLYIFIHCLLYIFFCRDSNLKQLAALEITDVSNVETLVVPG